MRRTLLVSTFVVSFLTLVAVVSYVKDAPWIRDGCELLGRLKGPLSWEDSTVLQNLRSSHLLQPSNLPINITDQKDNVYQQFKHRYGWSFFHYYNEEFFSQQKSGFFVEAGALDGEFMSNSLWLEQDQGWSGLLIEADPVNFQHLVWKRRRAWISNTCISEKPYPREAIFESLQEYATGYAVPWLYRANSRELHSYFSKMHGGYKDMSVAAYSKVQCFPLASHLLALNVTTVDYLSLDIQGSEWEVMKTFPFDTITVRVLALEHFIEAGNTEDGVSVADEDFVRYMKSIRYKLVDIEDNSNYVFVWESDPLSNKTVTLYKDSKNDKNTNDNNKPKG